jgi:tRNA (cmo5U34)-methyltransferase
MGVATHLGIRLSEYDKRIRTFIPRYEEMLDEAAGALDPRTRTIVDLGIGTGALSARCLRRATRARVIGIDADPDILALAGQRLGRKATLVHGSFVRTPLPRADAIVASIALHHVRTRSAKLRVYERIRKALRSGGVFVGADCYPSRNRWPQQLDVWMQHLRRTYPPREAEQLLDAWSHEDVYVPLEAELALLERAGFRKIDVIWRRGAFAVIATSGV